MGWSTNPVGCCRVGPQAVTRQHLNQTCKVVLILVSKVAANHSNNQGFSQGFWQIHLQLVCKLFFSSLGGTNLWITKDWAPHGTSHRPLVDPQSPQHTHGIHHFQNTETTHKVKQTKTLSEFWVTSRCIHLHIYIYIYIYTHKRKHIHIYIYTYVVYVCNGIDIIQNSLGHSVQL